MFQLIISHTVNGHFGLGTFRPFMGSITHSETYIVSQLSPTCFLRNWGLWLGSVRYNFWGYGQLGIVFNFIEKKNNGVNSKRPTLKNIPIPPFCSCWPSTVTACSVRYTLTCIIVINIFLIIN